MSNVLIGIIGVILFIGLALAGALFLGPRFQDSQNASKAAAVSQALNQMAAATNLYNVNTGEPMSTSEHDTVAATLASKGYLKSALTSPLDGAPIPIVLESGSRNPFGPGKFFYTNLGSSSTSRAICMQIERNAGNPDPEGSMEPLTDWKTRVTTNRRLGCLNDANATPSVYEAYVPI